MQPPPPSRRALVGFSGFVGQHLLSQTDFTDLYRSTNIASIASGGAEFELLVVCGLPAAKWLANKDPETDWRIVQELAALLTGCAAKQVVVVSTIDVYAQPGGCDENDDPEGQPNHAYGPRRIRNDARCCMKSRGSPSGPSFTWVPWLRPYIIALRWSDAFGLH